MSRILTVEQTAEKLQMSAKIVRQYLRQGKLPGRKIGRAWRVIEGELELWLRYPLAKPQGPKVSALGFLNRYRGDLSSAKMVADKRAEAELEEEKFECDKDKPERPA